MHRTSIFPALIVVILAAVLPIEAAAQVTFIPDTSRSIHVTGRGSVSAVPDTASVELGVFMADADARKAKALVDAAITRIVSLAKDLGVSETALNTAALNIEPRYDRDNPTRLRGYEVTRSVTVLLRDLSKLDALLDGAVQAGANRNFAVELTSSRAEALKKEALTLAIADGKAQAATSAQQLGVRVGSVRSISLNRASSIVNYSASATSTFGAPEAKFLPGAIRVDVEVSIVFTIEDGKAG